MLLVEPAMGRASMFCAEASFVGSALRLLRSREHVATFDVYQSLGYGGDDVEFSQRRRATRTALYNLMALLCYGAVVVCILGSGYGDAYLLYGPFEKGGPAFHEQHESFDTSWQTLLMEGALPASWGSLVALIFAVWDLQHQLSFALPAHPLPQPMEDNAHPQQPPQKPQPGETR